LLLATSFLCHFLKRNLNNITGKKMLNSNKLLRENFILYSKRNNNNNAPELFSSSTHRENCCSCILAFSKGMNWLMGGGLGGSGGQWYSVPWAQVRACGRTDVQVKTKQKTKRENRNERTKRRI
jgi:hypothetical protein